MLAPLAWWRPPPQPHRPSDGGHRRQEPGSIFLRTPFIGLVHRGGKGRVSTNASNSFFRTLFGAYLNANHGWRHVVDIAARVVAEGAKPEGWKEVAASVQPPLDKESRSGAPFPTLIVSINHPLFPYR